MTVRVCCRPTSSPALIAIVVAYVLVMLAVGWAAMRRTRDARDFFIGGRALGPWMSAFACGTTYFSAVLFIGYAGKLGWGFGIHTMWIVLGNTLVGTLAAWGLLAAHPGDDRPPRRAHDAGAPRGAVRLPRAEDRGGARRVRVPRPVLRVGPDVALSLALALAKPAVIVNLMVMSWGTLAGVFLAPYLYGLFWRRTTRAGVWAGVASGLGAAFLLFPAWGADGVPLAGAVVMLVPLAVVPAVSLFTRAPDPALVRAAFADADAAEAPPARGEALSA